MSAKLSFDAVSGLHFFGKMTASISHEIKNVLAILNENAGLLEDLALMAGRDAAIDPERLVKMAQAVKKQVSRADAIIKNMNRLAHSIDESEKSIDLNDMLELLVALSYRFASMRGVAVELTKKEGPVELRTAPFFLLNLLWLCLDFSMDAAGEGKRVELLTQKTEDGAEVFFKGLGSLAETSMKPLTAEHEKTLCDLLGARAKVLSDTREIIVRITGNINRNEENTRSLV